MPASSDAAAASEAPPSSAAAGAASAAFDDRQHDDEGRSRPPLIRVRPDSGGEEGRSLDGDDSVVASGRRRRGAMVTAAALGLTVVAALAFWLVHSVGSQPPAAAAGGRPRPVRPGGRAQMRRRIRHLRVARGIVPVPHPAHPDGLGGPGSGRAARRLRSVRRSDRILDRDYHGRVPQSRIAGALSTSGRRPGGCSCSSSRQPARRATRWPTGNSRRPPAVGTYPGYHQIRIQSVSYAEAEQAAAWEFTYNLDGVPTHVLNLNVLVNSHQALRPVLVQRRRASGPPADHLLHGVHGVVPPGERARHRRFRQLDCAPGGWPRGM